MSHHKSNDNDCTSVHVAPSATTTNARWGLAEFEQWIEEDLRRVELAFSDFVTERSLSRDEQLDRR